VSAGFRRAIVVGASSGMGEAVARRLAGDGCRVALVARRADELARVAREIDAAAGQPRASAHVHDVRQTAETPALFQAVCRELGGLDLIVYAAGVMPRVAADEYDFDKDRAMIEVNVLGAISWLNEAAQRFAAAGEGTIVGVSSVAGDRGRRGQPAYCASKAALDTYLESLRNRLRRRGVKVVTVKPGPVETPMTRGLGRLPLMIGADDAGRQILAAARRGSLRAYVPPSWRPIMWAIRHIPSVLFSRLNV
jgi:decaprenylphospho-beta-D-erythro-pentofuranosid-2-ulose 2-reductase